MVARVLENIEFDIQAMDEFLGRDLVRLYSITKTHLSYVSRKKILDRIIPFIYEQAKAIFRRGVSASLSHYKNYEPGDDWDIYMTIEKMLSLGKTLPDYEVILTKTPKIKKKNIVLCIDKSMSVMELIHQISITASILALSVKKENIAIIEFDSKARIIKSMHEHIEPDYLIQQILDIESGGKTNLYEAIQLATEQLQSITSSEKIVYIISDCDRTIGDNPLPLMAKIPEIKLIYAKTSRKIQFVDEILKLPTKLTFLELNRDTDLVELTKKMV